VAPFISAAKQKILRLALKFRWPQMTVFITYQLFQLDIVRTNIIVITIITITTTKEVVNFFSTKN